MSRIASSSSDPDSDTSRVIRIRPYYFIHVLNSNTNVARVEVGPNTFIRKDHEQIVLPPTPMVNIPPRSYCIVANPHVRDTKGRPQTLDQGQVRLRHGDQEVRLAADWVNPFPLYPGEVMKKNVALLDVIPPNTAYHVTALRDFTDSDSVKRVAGDEWLVHGPCTFIPRVEITTLKTVTARVIKPNCGIKLKARRKFRSRDGSTREVGDQWLVTAQGSYMADVCEEFVSEVKAEVITEKRALHLRATHAFTDAYDRKRRAGQEWLVTYDMGTTHLPGVFEEVVGEVHITTLTRQQYAVVLNPIDEKGNPRLGRRELRKGEQSFFLHPGETLANGIETVHLLGEEEALLLRCQDEFTETIDGKEHKRSPGQEWMIYGPRKYVPPVEVQVLEKRTNIPLDENEGIYVRDKETGRVYTIKGRTYMLKPNEETWDKVLPPEVEELLEVKKQKRVPYKVVRYRVPHNAAVQVYDYKLRRSRVVFGPELVMLEPDEQFSIISLSGGQPKRANAVVSLALSLGPDFMADSVVVETSDHARLNLKLSYNWAFDVNKTDQKDAHAIFSVRDFIGDTCKAIASRVRGAVAGKTFDDFHKNSANVIRQAVFGASETKAQAGSSDGGERLVFHANRLVVTNVDIQSVEPIEQETRTALQKSVQLAIEIATKSQEALANHEAQREEQIAEGRLQRQIIADASEAELENKSLVELKAKTAAVKSTGQAKAEAIARAESALIKGRAAVRQAELKAQASRIRARARLEQLKLQQQQELEHRKALDDLEIDKAAKQAKIEAEKFRNIVQAIGPDTIEAIAQAGPEMQAKLLEGLGLQGFLVTDGASPINLFNTAAGLVGNSMGGGGGGGGGGTVRDVRETKSE